MVRRQHRRPSLRDSSRWHGASVGRYRDVDVDRAGDFRFLFIGDVAGFPVGAFADFADIAIVFVVVVVFW